MKGIWKITLAAALAAPLAASAANFNGKDPVLCATLEAIRCDKPPGASHVCARGLAAGLNVPQFIKVDFANNEVTATTETGVADVSAIGRVSRGNGHIVVLGADEGHGWALALEERSGYMTASVVGDVEGLMIFAACTQI